MIKSRFLGTGSYLPERVVTNEDLAQMMDTSDEWIVTRSGIRERHWVTGTTSTSDLALKAAQNALKASGLDAQKLDAILLATLSPDHDFPGTACFLQQKLGVPGIPAIDIRQQCSGFLYALSVADHFIRLGTYKNILVVGAEVHSKGLDLTTEGRDVSVLFGDGAGAVVLTADDRNDFKKSDSQIFSVHLHADGSFAKELWVEAPSMTYAKDRLSPEILKEKRHFPQMNGKTVFLNAVRRMPEAVLEALSKNSVEIDEIDLFIFHQANLRINEMVAKQLKIPENKVFNTIQKFGNTTAATIPIGLDEAVKCGRLKKGDLVVSAAFGSGFTWASSLFRW